MKMKKFSIVAVSFLAGCCLTWSLFLLLALLTQPKITSETQTWLKNATPIRSLPPGCAIQPATYARSLIDNGAETKLKVEEKNSRIVTITVVAKDQGPYWATTQIEIPQISTAYKITSAAVHDGTMVTTSVRDYALPVGICILLLFFAIVLFLIIA